LYSGALMPWVDPETIGPQVLSYYAWPFLIFAIPNIFLICAVLFAIATLLRSMMAAYIGAVVLVMVYLVAGTILATKIEYRETVARWEPLGTGALQEATRYWTQSELNSRLLEFSGTLLFNRIFCIIFGLLFVAVTVWRFSMTERAPSKWRLRRLARREERAAKAAAVAPVLDGASVI